MALTTSMCDGSSILCPTFISFWLVIIAYRKAKVRRVSGCQQNNATFPVFTVLSKPNINDLTSICSHQPLDCLIRSLTRSSKYPAEFFPFLLQHSHPQTCAVLPTNSMFAHHLHHCKSLLYLKKKIIIIIQLEIGKGLAGVWVGAPNITLDD